MQEIIPRDEWLKNQSTEFLINESKISNYIIRSKIYNELCIRIDQEPELVNFVFNIINEPKNRNEYFFGFIKVAWIPIISILSLNNEVLTSKLKMALIKNWNTKERNDFYEYVKNEFDMKDIL